MRLFRNIEEAQKEIRRDLFKSPRLLSTRVQHLEIEQEMVEALNYSYSIMSGGVPDSARGLRPILEKDWDEAEADQIIRWMEEESVHRYRNGGELILGDPPDLRHPGLVSMVEGNHFSYTYNERLMGATDHIAYQLHLAPDTRRAFWPVFQHQDAIRAPMMTRIPCTLGYYFNLRSVPGEILPRLNITYISRSCDFGKFWATDLWMANNFKLQVMESLIPYMDVAEGLTSHIVLSFHRFLEEGEETF